MTYSHSSFGFLSSSTRATRRSRYCRKTRPAASTAGALRSGMACSSGCESSGNDQTWRSGRGGLGRGGGFGAAAGCGGADAGRGRRRRRRLFGRGGRLLAARGCRWRPRSLACWRSAGQDGTAGLAVDVRPPAQGFPVGRTAEAEAAEPARWRLRRLLTRLPRSAAGGGARTVGGVRGGGRFAAARRRGKAVRPGVVPCCGVPLPAATHAPAGCAWRRPLGGRLLALAAAADRAATAASRGPAAADTVPECLAG